MTKFYDREEVLEILEKEYNLDLTDWEDEMTDEETGLTEDGERLINWIDFDIVAQEYFDYHDKEDAWTRKSA